MFKGLGQMGDMAKMMKAAQEMQGKIGDVVQPVAKGRQVAVRRDDPATHDSDFVHRVGLPWRVETDIVCQALPHGAQRAARLPPSPRAGPCPASLELQ